MPDTTTLAAQFKELFRSHPNVYNRTDILAGVDENGKANSRTWFVKEDLTDEVWQRHLSGEKSIGCVPIKPNNMVSWGAVDIDTYDGTVDRLEIQRKITEHSLPFIMGRSKSGGIHLYIFLEREVLAKDMVAKLEGFAAFFGQGDAEIFPKQVKLGSNDNDSDFGNALSMPYDGEASLRYATNDGGSSLGAADFIEYARARTLSITAFRELAVPSVGEVFPNGPPCLNYIFAERTQENDSRNVTLSNVAVYLKKSVGEGWQDKLNEANQMFETPLTDNELSVIKKSYARKDYRYSCSKQPLCSYCNARVCKTKTFGIGKDEIVPSNRSLRKLETDPPIWYLTIDDKEMKLTTEELYNFNKFNKRAMEVLNTVFQPYKQSEWLENIGSIMQSCEKIHVPEELTETGIFHELLSEYLSQAQEGDPEVLRRELPYIRNECVLFRGSALMKFLERRAFREMSRTDVCALLRKKYKGKLRKPHVGNTTISCWELHESVYEPVPELPETHIDNPDPF